MTAQAKLLVVDDEPSLQDIVATSMRFLGYQVSVAATGREAVRLAVELQPDLIILDVMLPDFDGLEVMRRVRASGRRRRGGVPVGLDTPRDKIAGADRRVTTTSPSRSGWRNSPPGSAPCCAGSARTTPARACCGSATWSSTRRPTR